MTTRSIGFRLLPFALLATLAALVVPGNAQAKVGISPVHWFYLDYDRDCLSNISELLGGTDMYDPDTDGDGWFDGPCNERRRLHLTRIKAHDEQEDWGEDEIYVVVDDVRYPNDTGLDDYWSFDDGDSRNYNLLVAERTRGVNPKGWLRNAAVQLWEDDFEMTNTWAVDDLLGNWRVNLGDYSDGQTFSIRVSTGDWDYELTFRVEIEYFADPTPLADGDADGDGIADSAEYDVAAAFGGIADPYRSDILVEVDWMSGHSMTTVAKRQVVTQFNRRGYHVYISRNQSLSIDRCLTRTEARDLYNTHFDYVGYDAFRYAVLTETLWSGEEGDGIRDMVLVDDSMPWIQGDVLAQAGTFMNNLGHTLGLTPAASPLIDTMAWLSYPSAMNLLFQSTLVDYSDGPDSGTNHDDWADVDPGYGMVYSFGRDRTIDNGVCR